MHLSTQKTYENNIFFLDKETDIELQYIGEKSKNQGTLQYQFKYCIIHYIDQSKNIAH